MKEINLRDFYPWYKENVIIEVTEEVAEELLAGQRYIKASRRRVYRNKAHYSLDAEDGIEYSACFSNPSPQELIERMERFEQLCHALNSLPDAQGQRVFEHYLLGHSVKAIAAAEGVTERAITAAIQRGLENMKKYLKKCSVSLFLFPFKLTRLMRGKTILPQLNSGQLGVPSREPGGRYAKTFP